MQYIRHPGLAHILARVLGEIETQRAETSNTAVVLGEHDAMMANVDSKDDDMQAIDIPPIGRNLQDTRNQMSFSMGVHASMHAPHNQPSQVASESIAQIIDMVENEMSHSTGVQASMHAPRNRPSQMATESIAEAIDVVDNGAVMPTDHHTTSIQQQLPVEVPTVLGKRKQPGKEINDCMSPRKIRCRNGQGWPLQSIVGWRWNFVQQEKNVGLAECKQNQATKAMQNMRMDSNIPKSHLEGVGHEANSSTSPLPIQLVAANSYPQEKIGYEGPSSGAFNCFVLAIGKSTMNMCE